MPKIVTSGPFHLRAKSLWALNRIALATFLRHATGRKMAPDWPINMEIGIRFVRHQFTAALRHDDISVGRRLFDSVQLETDDIYEVSVENTSEPNGCWYRPKSRTSDATLLYLHGGGYTFHGAVSRRFAAMLAHRIGADLFAPDYRLTPEHAHPAQAEDALAAWRYVTDKTCPSKTVVIGDSAGGHMALMLLQSLKALGVSQPALCVGLCPWTDIGALGKSLQTNDPTDLVQGWMALQFGKFLDPQETFGREILSPFYQDFSGLAPIYLQTGAREVLHDMIVEFARHQQVLGADVQLDTWPDMPHDFQAYDQMTASSQEAITALIAKVRSATQP